MQVHEKSVLLPLMPVTLLWVDESLAASLLPIVASLSMFPLLKRDGLSLAYCASLILWSAGVFPAVAEKVRKQG